MYTVMSLTCIHPEAYIHTAYSVGSIIEASEVD